MKISSSAVVLFLFSLSSSFAQFPSGTLIHLSAESGVVETGGKASEWQDVASTIKFFAPATENQPSTTTSTINGHKTVSFDGVANYLEGPSIFPTGKDYTICVVLRVNAFTLPNNIISGTTHATYFTGNTPRFLHGNFNATAASSIALSNTPALIVAHFNQENQYATFHVNGAFADSAFVGTNTDSTVYIASYQRGNFFIGDIAEIFVFPRVLSDIDRNQLQDSLLNKYAIARPSPPDRTFSEAPQSLELYPRDEDDSATVTIKALLPAKGFDSVYLRVLKNATLLRYFSKPLSYSTEGASFLFEPRIHAELSEYTFIVGIKSKTADSVLIRRDSIVCGDVYFIDGQSNSICGIDPYTNEFCRTFGINYSQSKSDTLWALSVGAGCGGNTGVGGFGMRIQRDFVEQMKIPTVVINGGVGGTTIEQHLPNDTNPADLQTIYGSMLYRAKQSGLAKQAKALFWYQGESNSITNYFDNFKRLYNAWHIDYPEVKKFYLIQYRPGCAGNSGELRDLIRTLPSYYPDVVAHTTMALPSHDGCHFFTSTDGYNNLGDQLYSLLLRDFYNGTDTTGINSPDIIKAIFTDDTHRKIALVFNTGGSSMVIPSDTVIAGITASIKDYIYVGSEPSLVTSVTANGDTVFLELAHSTNARTISYLPDQNYNGTATIYEGPWLTNKRGLGAFSFWDVPIVYNLEVQPLVDNSDNLFSVYPNPASAVVKFRINLKEHSNVNLILFDELGRELTRVVDGDYSAGSYELPFDVQRLSRSFVIARLTVNNKAYEQLLDIRD